MFEDKDMAVSAGSTSNPFWEWFIALSKVQQSSSVLLQGVDNDKYLVEKQYFEKHGVSPERITQWLCLLKLPEDKLREIENLSDCWDGTTAFCLLQ